MSSNPSKFPMHCLAWPREDPPEHVVPDLKNFIRPLYLKKAKQMQEELSKKYENLSDTSMTVREELGLQFAEEVVNLFLTAGAFNEEVCCLENGRVTCLLPIASRALFGVYVSSNPWKLLFLPLLSLRFWCLQFEVRLGMLENIASDDEKLLLFIAGSICKDFSSMGDGKRLVGKHAAWRY